MSEKLAIIEESILQDTADAIRSKNNTTSKIEPKNFKSNILKISGGEDVSAETTQYTSLLTDLETAIDALPDTGSGSGGGTDMETCTVSVTDQTGNHMQIFYTAYVNGIYDDGYMYNSGVLTNVMCNTVILIEITGASKPTVQVSGDVELLDISSTMTSGYFILLMSNSSNGGDVIISSVAGGGYP